MSEEVMSKEVRLVSVSRGFGGDNAYYRGPSGENILVTVNWALLHPFLTTVLVDGVKAAEFIDARCVQPAEALSRLGYTVHGTVDFAACVQPNEAGAESQAVPSDFHQPTLPPC